MFEASIQGLAAIFTANSLIFMLLGIVFGLIIGFLPGLGGIVAMALLLPFTFGLDPTVAFALLIGGHTGTMFGDSITSILFNVPGAAKSTVMCFDGFPLTQKGEGLRALAAAAMSSLLGGILGAIALTVSLPLMRAIMLALTAPEYLMFALWGLTIIAIFSEGSVIKGLIAAGFGLGVAFIGMDTVTGTARFTFGNIQLMDGIDFPVAIMGLFAVSQMMKMMTQGGSIVKKKATIAEGGMMDGIKDTFRSWRLVIMGSLMGIFIGILPGIGASVGSIAAYSQAVNLSRRPEKFGHGNIDGIIGPASSNAACEGGSLIPTLGFGIPGSETAVLILSAFVMLGIQPGKEMMTNNAHLFFNLVWLIVITNIISTMSGLAMSKYLVRITTMPGSIIIPIMMAICLAGSYSISGRVSDVLITTVFALIGFFMDKYNYSKADFIIGMVLGVTVERYMHISLTLYGNDFLIQRPLSLVLLILVIFSVAWPFIKRRANERKRAQGVSQ